MAATHRFPLPTRNAWVLALAALSVPAVAADGLTLDREAIWPRWQARLSITDTPDPAARQRAALLGDYDLGTFGLSLPFANGRFRATSGLLFDLRGRAAHGTPWATTPAWPPLALAHTSLGSAPYIGLGYSAWVPKTGLSFSADIGVSADYPGGTWRFGRALFGTQGFDATLRELRLQPRLQLGVQYRY